MPEDNDPKQPEPLQSEQINQDQLADDGFEQIDTRRRIDKGEDPDFVTKEDQRNKK